MKTLRIKSINGDTNFQDVTLQVTDVQETFLVIYGSGFLYPNAGSGHNTGKSFDKLATARHKINQENNPQANCVMKYCPTDVEFFETINSQTAIKRLDIYSHAWVQGLNLGGFEGKRMIEGIEYYSEQLIWDKKEEKGYDLRRVEMLKGELENLNEFAFSDNVEVYLWGCNAGGQLDPKGKHIAVNGYSDPSSKDPKNTFAQKLAEKIGKGSVFALVGKGNGGGSMFKTDEKGIAFYDDAEMLPANISLNHNNINTKKLKAKDYFKKFPL